MKEQSFLFHFEGHEERRLDHFLVLCLPQFSRSRIQSLIKAGSVHVDGQPITKAGQMLGKGTVIDIEVPAAIPTRLTGEKIPLDIVYENDDVVIINKPAGMVVHPAAGHYSGTLANAVLGHNPAMEGIGGQERPGVVHRLDKATSGLILMAKNDEALHWLQEQFRLRRVGKTYMALVDGKPPTPSGRIETAIGRDPSHRKQMAIVSAGKGREAISEYSTLESFHEHTLLEFRPVTGRTHQIRLHCAFLGSPIVGDTIYGRKKPSLELGRHFLHACKLVIRLPGEESAREFNATLPVDLEQALILVRRSAEAIHG